MGQLRTGEAKRAKACDCSAKKGASRPDAIASGGMSSTESEKTRLRLLLDAVLRGSHFCKLLYDRPQA